jgi:CubicO group peptidase (beta-lactamase class C family)
VFPKTASSERIGHRLMIDGALTFGRNELVLLAPRRQRSEMLNRRPDRPIGMVLWAVVAVCCWLACFLRPNAAHGRTPNAGLPPCKANLTKYLQRLDVPGVAAGIVKDGRLVCASGAGMANIEKNIPVAPETLFLVASVSKTVTATALMQLYEQGKFKLDDDINRFLPFRVRIPRYPTAPITFRQLLTHTSSIIDNEKYINCPGTCEYGSDLISFVTKEADSPISLKDFTTGYFVRNGAYYHKRANF